MVALLDAFGSILYSVYCIYKVVQCALLWLLIWLVYSTYRLCYCGCQYIAVLDSNVLYIVA